MRIPLLLPALVIALLMGQSVAAADPETPEMPVDWAYKPVATASPAPGFVDQQLQARLAKAKLAYAPAADRTTMIRRLSYDLTGLPPTPEQVAAFTQDTHADAYGKMVRRLLDSPHFGERVALWWLDVVRYAESDGFKSDEARPSAWRYRDYVIASFNSDKPYDRFLQEQIAGDELYPNDIQAKIATGFLRHFPDESNAVNLEQRRQEILNDITDTTAAAFLGITLGCAKCHDHKTDPIAQHDYYRLQAFFAGFKPTDVPVVAKGEYEGYLKKKQAWEERTAELRQQIAEIEKPFRDKAAQKERQRFPEEYLQMLDKPAAERTPLEEQIATMVAKQVFSARKFSPTQMKAEERQKWEGMSKKMGELAKEKPPEPPTAMVMSDLPNKAPVTHLLKRGDWRKPGEEIEPGFLSAIDDRDAELKPTPSGTTGRRAALAKWVTDRKNPFTARVMVNRIWQQLFGRGIVASPSDFGGTGERPTHPELLDALAREFMDHGWSVKHIYRVILESQAYQQSAHGSDSGYKVDPENRLLWQMPRKRLDGETLRDAILSVVGKLNPETGGPSVYPELPIEVKAYGGWKMSEDEKDRNRRSIYVAVKRNIRYPLFSLFDSPDRCETCARRFQTTTAPQALSLLNDKLVLAFAKQFAQRVLKEAGKDGDRILDRAFLLTMNRKPTSEERATLGDYLAKHGGVTEESVGDICHALLNLNEFLYID